mmetsp:Transcript_4917/g.7445  ORF Transcript_4917/g.7445 Transcript_4917/m.7445 type:complete len:344 (-) Transcript_4917:182-1213(-)
MMILWTILILGTASGRVVQRVNNADGGKVSAAVIDNTDSGIRFMRYGDCLLGAKFVDEQYEEYSPFSAFQIMGAAVCMVSYKQTEPGRFLQLGLGTGFVPMHVKRNACYSMVDAVDNSSVVKSFAEEHFGYNAGSVILDEARAYMERKSQECASDTNALYDLVAMDLYIGLNPTHVLNKKMFEQVKLSLNKKQGVFLVNFVGFVQGKHKAFSCSLVGTLRAVFNKVSCFRDNPPSYNENSASNIMCFSSDFPTLVDFGKPDPIQASIDPSKVTSDWIQSNFYHWAVLEEDECVVDENHAEVVLIEEDVKKTAALFEEFEESFQAAASELESLIFPYLSPDEWV